MVYLWKPSLVPREGKWWPSCLDSLCYRLYGSSFFLSISFSFFFCFVFWTPRLLLNSIFDIFWGTQFKACKWLRKIIKIIMEKTHYWNKMKMCIMYIKTLLPIITTLVNKSITKSYVPATFRKAVVRPLLKKPGLDQNVLKNYRPVSNLPFVSKILEKVVANRLDEHLESNSLHHDLQSAYRACHSTKNCFTSGTPWHYVSSR